jgi:hypothetical protein
LEGGVALRVTGTAPLPLSDPVPSRTPEARKPMRMVLVIAAVASIAFILIAVGRAWYDFRPLTNEERARIRQEGD